MTTNAYGRGVRAAVERLGARRLANFDSHRWVVLRWPSPMWVCSRCTVAAENASACRCPGDVPME